MRTTARRPSIKRAKGNPSVPIARPIDARSQQSLQDGIEQRDAQARSLAEENDLSWLVPGALAYVKQDMMLQPATTKGDVDRLVPDQYGYGNGKFKRGSAVVFSDAERKQITHHKRGPMRIIRHVWIGHDGSKFSISLEHLQRDNPDLG